MRSWIDALVSVLLAPVCAACGRLLDRPTEGPGCASCWTGILPLTPPFCTRCGDPWPSWRADVPSAICVRCRRLRHHIDGARAIGPYEGALRSIIHAFKYDGR